MPEFILAFSYKGFEPGRIIEVDEDDVKNLVIHGVGRPVNSEVTLHLGSSPELQEPVEAPAEQDPEPAPEPQAKTSRRTKKTEEPEAAEESAES